MTRAADGAHVRAQVRKKQRNTELKDEEKEEKIKMKRYYLNF